MATIPRECLINKLRELRYEYKDQGKKMQEWRQKGTSHSIMIRRKEDPLSEEYVRIVLRHAGCEKDDIERFVNEYRRH